MTYGFSLFARLALLSVLLVTASGCQLHPTVVSLRLMEHRDTVDLSGLAPLETYHAVRASAAPPENWAPLKLTRTGPMVHQQWRSPSKKTGLGVAHVRLPLPLSARTLLWIARAHYTKQSDDGKLIDQWTDALGRPWFEAENARYHVRGYAMTHGFDAWFVYVGYKMRYPPDVQELGLAGKALETVMPTDISK